MCYESCVTNQWVQNSEAFLSLRPYGLNAVSHEATLSKKERTHLLTVKLTHDKFNLCIHMFVQMFTLVLISGATKSNQAPRQAIHCMHHVHTLEAIYERYDMRIYIYD